MADQPHALSSPTVVFSLESTRTQAHSSLLNCKQIRTKEKKKARKDAASKSKSYAQGADNAQSSQQIWTKHTERIGGGRRRVAHVLRFQAIPEVEEGMHAPNLLTLSVLLTLELLSLFPLVFLRSCE